MQQAIAESKRSSSSRRADTNGASTSSGSSTTRVPSPSEWTPDFAARSRQLKGKLAEIDMEVKDIEDNIATLQRLKKEKLASRTEIQQQLDNSTGGTKKRKGAMDYFQPREWSREMKRKLKEVFDIDSFRLAQEGCVPCSHSPVCTHQVVRSVCNANMDQRDIVCIMPTGMLFSYSVSSMHRCSDMVHQAGASP
jgi:ATP-dependent DNA helicase Q1